MRASDVLGVVVFIEAKGTFLVSSSDASSLWQAFEGSAV